MTIAGNGTPTALSWTDGSLTKAVPATFGSALSNALLVMSVALTSLDTFPGYVSSITDTRGNTWVPVDMISRYTWSAGGITFKSNTPVALSTQLWYAYDTASPASGYTATLNIKSVYTNDSGTPHAMALDVGIAHLIRVSGAYTNPSSAVYTNTPLDSFANPNNMLDDGSGKLSGGGAGARSSLDAGSTSTQPSQANLFGSNTTNIAIVAAFGGVGTLEYANIGTTFTNNGGAVPADGGDINLRTNVNGYFDGGPGQNAAGLVTNLKCGITGPWNPANNSIVNANGVTVQEMITRVFTSDAQPRKARRHARIIT